MNWKFFFKIILTFFINIINVYSNWESGFLGLLEKLDEDKLINLPVISIWYGVGLNDNSLLNPFEEFATTYNLGIEYGFIRIKKDKTTSPYYLHFGERVYFENQSSHLKPKTWNTNGKTMDGWVFGLKAIDGIGIKSDFKGIELQHSASLIWTRFDFEDYFRNIETNKRIQIFDQQYKFGRNYGNALSIQFSDKVGIGLNYNINFIYPEFELGKWTIAYITEIGLQKWIDIFDYKLEKEIGTNYWFYKYLYKTFVTFLITNQMIKKPYLFFNTDRAFLNQIALIKFSYIGF